jgi:hypothetical protein
LERAVRFHSDRWCFNSLHHTGEIGIDIRIPESKDSKSLRLQKYVANLIRSSAFRHSVLAAVCFDNELRSERNEVNDVTADGCLSPKMKAEGFQFAQLYPQFDFLRREPLTQRASIFVCQGYPHPTGLTAGHPPHKGEG